MTHVDDLQRIISDAVINQVRKRDDWKHPNAGHISRTPEARILRKQLAGGPDTSYYCACSTPVVLRDIFVNSVNVSAGTPGVPKLHSPHFFQSAAIS
jgi:hypothetical protein